jgi:3-phenylpropionate/cinnamic acid dioxygenase small subunit
VSEVTEDYIAINNLLSEYALASDESRYEDWARLFGEDGEMHAFRRVWKGFDELVSFISAAPEGIHICGLPRIDIQGDRADATVNFAFLRFEDKQVWSMGHYINELVKTSEGWRYKTLKIKILKPTKPPEEAS